MITEFLNGHDIRRMLEAALAGLAERYKEIDALNVFPVPDGDTGTNMYLTLTSAVQEAADVTDPSSVGLVAEAAARGALMGARGNSGVILSQLLRGFAQELKTTNMANSNAVARALEEGVAVAFKAIIKPVEGTILTVAREAAKAARKMSSQRPKISDVLHFACDAAETTLNNTPQMLPALAEAGVVDAGGMGWLVILQGFHAGVTGLSDNGFSKTVSDQGEFLQRDVPGANDLRYPYCTELLVYTAGGIKGLQGRLEQLGDSIMLAESGNLTRVHVHSAHPGEVIETCLQYGALKDVKVTNMRDQAAQGGPAVAPAPGPGGKHFGIVAVAMGEGIKSVMESLGADMVIAGGQTMNPSTQEMLAALEQIPTEKVIILPNNKNIILTANQLADLSEKNIAVIPTKTIPQGLAALLAVTPGDDFEKTLKSMNEASGRVKTGEVTYAVRATKVNNLVIEKDDIIGLFDDEIAASGSELKDVVTSLMEKMLTPDNEICSLYYGETVSTEEAEELVNHLAERFPEIEYELISGGQPLYYYIISLE